MRTNQVTADRLALAADFPAALELLPAAIAPSNLPTTGPGIAGYLIFIVPIPAMPEVQAPLRLPGRTTLDGEPDRRFLRGEARTARQKLGDARGASAREACDCP